MVIAMPERMMFSLGLILSGLLFGYTIKLLTEAGCIKLPVDLEVVRKTLQKGVLLFVIPVSVIGALWIVSFDDRRLAFLPLLGASHYLTGGLLALAAARIMKLDRKKTGTFFCCGFFTNIGAVGGLITYMLLGERGYALVPVYKLFAEMIYYSTGFPVARYYSFPGENKESVRGILERMSRDIFVKVAIFAIIVGAILNISGIQRPEFYKSLNAVFIPLGTFTMLTAIGMGMRFGKVRSYVRECFAILLIRSVFLPVILISVSILTGFNGIWGGLPLKVVIILSFMPVAFITLVPASIYDLDLDLANACWLVSTFSMIFVIPLICRLISLAG